MSIEVGVVLAFLTNRFLLLDGNVPPPANVVAYQGRVENKVMSRVTDLIDIPVPWGEPDEDVVAKIESKELTERSIMDSVFYVPGTVDIESEDAKHFARGREVWLCESEELFDLPMLRVSEKPVPKGAEFHRTNLSFYSYFFYFDDETRRSAYQVLQRMQAKAPYAELARKVAADLGDFNAVHMRRGDFKVTYGVTVLDRHPWEAIESLEKHFEHDERLLICTDERDDPFFDDLKTTWRDHVFIDHHILDNYGKEFFDLPQHDSIALAYLSQLVAAESQDFVGTMTSTFTSMIQRMRGNRGKEEPFKFLWNELPEPGDRYERGRHPVSECVPLEDGIMIEEFEGPYSWNRYNQRINPSWMREWPESFLTEAVLETGSLRATRAANVVPIAGGSQVSEAQLHFEGVRVRIRSEVPGIAFKLSEVLNRGRRGDQDSVIADLEIRQVDEAYELLSGESSLACANSKTEITGELIRHLVRRLSNARRNHVWFIGMLFRKGEHTIVYTGDLGGSDGSVADAMCSAGWEMLADEVIPVRVKTLTAVPFVRMTWPKGAAARLQWDDAKVTHFVHGKTRLHGRDSLMPLPPAVGAAELLQQCYDFRFDRDRATERLCKVAAEAPVYALTFSETENIPRTLEVLAEYDRRDESAAPAAGGN
jgi:hypothetical protein